MIKSLLAPYETYIWAAMAILLLVSGVFEIHHLENIGVHRQLAADAKLAQAQLVHKQEVEDRARQIVAANDAQLHRALVAPNPVPSVSVRVCKQPSASKHAVSANGSSVSGSTSGSTPVRGAVAQGSGGTGVDIAPSTEALLERADAEIEYWHKYYAACKAAGACK